MTRHNFINFNIMLDAPVFNFLRNASKLSITYQIFALIFFDILSGWIKMLLDGDMIYHIPYTISRSINIYTYYT